MSSVCPLSASGLTRPISTRERGFTLWTQKEIHQYARHDKHLQSLAQSTDDAMCALSSFYTFSILLYGREMHSSPLEPASVENASLRLHGNHGRALCHSTLPPTMGSPWVTQDCNPWGDSRRVHATGKVHDSFVVPLVFQNWQQPVQAEKSSSKVVCSDLQVSIFPIFIMHWEPMVWTSRLKVLLHYSNFCHDSYKKKKLEGVISEGGRRGI